MRRKEMQLLYLALIMGLIVGGARDTLFANTPPGTFAIECSVSNEQALRTAKEDMDLILDFSASQLPPKTRLKLVLNRIYPVLDKKTGFKEFMLRFDQFNVRKRDGIFQKTWSLQANRGLPPMVGYYRLLLTVDDGQQPDVDSQLGDAADQLRCEKLIFVGAVSEALQRVFTETQSAISMAERQLTIFNATRPGAVMPRPKKNIPIQTNDKENENHTEETTDEQTEEVEPDDNETATDDAGEPAEARYVYTAAEAAELLKTQALAMHQQTKTLTMPEINEVNLAMNSTMLASLFPLPGMTDIANTMERYSAASQVVILRMAVMNLHFFLDDAYRHFDSGFENLVEHPDADLQTQLTQEWRALSDEADALWGKLRAAYLHESYLSTLRELSSQGDIPNSMRQVEADNLAFVALMLNEEKKLSEENNFIATVQEYMSLINRLQQAYAQRLEEGVESTATSTIVNTKKQINELDTEIRESLRLHGEIGEPKKTTAPTDE